jgi:hypothetical protein
MSNPKEKATELVNKHFDYVEAWSVSNQLENARQCALITVNEIQIYLNEVMLPNPFDQYLYEVKTEIKKITI